MPLLGKAPRDAVVVRALAFGHPDGSLWAAGLDAGAPALIAGGTASLAAAVAWEAGGSEWTLSGDGVSLTVAPVDEPTPSQDADRAATGPESDAGAGAQRQAAPPWSGRQERCRVIGTLAGADVDAGGLRTELVDVDAAQLGSIRAFSGWLADESLTLLALRAGGEAHHERDLVAATVFDSDRWRPSIDPRLSTTYDRDGEPSRATLELWVADGEREVPRRAAGEATGPAARLASDQMTLRVWPLRCHSRGNDGAGVYLLAER